MDYQLHELLRRHGLSRTAARTAVYRTLKLEPAITIQALYAKTSGRLDRASLYRTLNLFRKLGVVQDVVMAGKRKLELTDSFSPHHHHIACTSCGSAITINDETFERQIENLAEAHGFTHTAHSFEITGVCKGCSIKAKAL